MQKFIATPLVGLATLIGLSACDGDHGNGYYPGPPNQLTSFVGTTGVFAAYADPSSGNFDFAAIGSYAGKRQAQHGSIDFLTGQALQQPAAVQIYKGNDGHIYELDMTTFGTPTPQQVSSETAATVDDTCSLTGTAVAGADSDYAGVFFAADLQTTTNSSYFYRLPGADGACNTSDDVIHIVKTGMSASDAPIVASGMPTVAVHTASGGISGFVVKSGANLVLIDSNFANPVVLGTFAAAIGVATALPVGTVQGYPTGQLFVIDGNIVYVDYVAHTTSAPLFAIPGWTPTEPVALYAASPTTLYFSVSVPASPTVAASATLYALPANGSAAPTLIDTEAGRISQLQFPVQSTNALFSVEAQTYTLRALPAAGGAAVTVASATQNAGTFTATASTIYYTTWTASFDSTTNVVTHSGTQSGIVGVNGSVIQAPLASSSFLTGGEQLPWPDDTTTTQTAYMTVFQITGLSTVTVTNPTTGTQYVEDGVSGGMLSSIDTTSNQVVAQIGMLPTSSATALSGTFRGYGDTGFIEATNALSTQDPATRDLYLMNSQSSNTLLRVTGNL